MEFLSRHICKVCTRGKFTQQRYPEPISIQNFCELSRASACNSSTLTQHRIAYSALYLKIATLCTKYRPMVHGVGHTYLLRVCYARLLTTSTVHIFIRVQSIVPFRVPVLVEFYLSTFFQYAYFSIILQVNACLLSLQCILTPASSVESALSSSVPTPNTIIKVDLSFIN